MCRNQIKLHVWGDYACFTNPECKVERYSYPVMTPSAARGILEAIYYKPAIRWIIDEIQVLNPVKYISVKRNEVSTKMATNTVFSSAAKGKAIYQDTNNVRQQRTTTMLKDVAYVIVAHFEETGQADESNEGKHYNIFKRRALKGQCFHTPYFGCREFTAHFEWLELDAPTTPIDMTKVLGYMLYDMDFEHPRTDGGISPIFFNGVIEKGILKVPHLKEVLPYDY